MIWLIIIAILVAMRLLRPWLPANMLLSWLRTRQGLEWGIRAMLIGIAYLAIAYWCRTLVEGGGPEWLHLVVVIGIYNGLRFIFNGPVSMIRLRAARRNERLTQQRTPGVERPLTPESVAMT